MGSYLEIFKQRIAGNVASISKLCSSYGVGLYGVTKVFCAEPALVSVFVENGVDGLADSRVENLETLRKINTGLPLMLLRLPCISEAKTVVTVADLSLNSELETLKSLDHAARNQGKKHRVVIMVDVGDLREGLMPENADSFFSQAVTLENISITGIGTNTACYGGVIPTPENMQALLDVRELMQKKHGLSLEMVSAGNSSALPLLQSGSLPQGINSFRVGETIVLGRNVIDRSPFPGTRQDTFVFHGEIIEYGPKPSKPLGKTGQNAFGESTEFEDRGLINRAIVAAGRQDLLVENLSPMDNEVFILGASSDHLIVEVRGNPDRYRVGSLIPFFPGYGCLLSLMTSRYVRKIYRD